jgi:hypothetical protein
MLRLVLGVLAGAVVAVALVAGLEMLGHLLFPPPPGLDVSDPEQLAAMMAQVPLPAKVWVVAAWTLATMGGGVTAALISRRGWTAWVIAALVAAAAVATLFMIPHPLWMQIGAVAGPLAGGWLAGVVAKWWKPAAAV